MLFCERLTRLSEIYRISNVYLARGIGADPSLVSRWKSGERALKPTSPFIGAIAGFLAGEPLLAVDHQQLCLTVGQPCQERQETERAIALWLAYDRPDAARSFDTVRQDALWSMLDLIEEGEGSPHHAGGPVSLWPRVASGAPRNHELFSGAQGRRQSVINFLHSVMAHNKFVEVYILDMGPGLWRTEDEEFSQLWRRALEAIVEQGHLIHYVIPPIEDRAGMERVLPELMPLVATGRFEVYTQQDGSETTALETMMVARGCSALMCYSAGGEATSMFYRGEGDSEVFERVFLARFTTSRPLMVASARDNPLGAARRLLALEDQEGEMCCLRHSFGSQWLDEGTILRHLERCRSPHADQLLDIFARRREIFEQCLAGAGWTEILPVTLLEAAAQNGSCRIRGSSLFCGEDLVLEGEELTALLERMAGLMRQSDRLHLLFLEDFPSALDITLKGEAGLWAQMPESGPSAGVLVSEGDFIGPMRLWFDKRRQSAQSHRRHVIDQIEQTARYWRPGTV